MDTTDQVSEQAASAGDVPTSQDGQPSASVDFVASTTVDTKEKDSATPPVENKDAKEWRKSDKEWQETQEKAKRADDLAKTNVELETRVVQLEEENRRKDWEAEHPNVKTEKYRDPWQDMIKKKAHLIKSGDLTYDDVFKLIQDPSDLNRVKEVREELREAETQVSPSIPLSSKGVTRGNPAVSPKALEMLRAAFPTMTDDELAALV